MADDEKQKTETEFVEKALSKIQLVALVAVMDNVARAKQVLAEAGAEQNTVLAELAKELELPDNTTFHITPDLQSKGLIRAQLPE
jgi:hypothetical protein